ncbi:DUF4333 domain-containing protein [Saccharopolyspora sp. CA-218241]|uniref:DUF4333 domain-containing protein n=1 Tax=Saccharopolyspora sp. CA-218241 TaxID=3240027 RepID=UPI003D967890
MSSPYGPPGGAPQWGPPGPAYPQGYGPPGGYPQQPPGYGYGGYAAPQQPEMFGGRGFGGPQPPRRKRSALPWVLTAVGLVVVAAVVGVLGFIAPGWFNRTVLDASSVEKGVERTLAESYQLAGIEQVRCPEGEPVEPGRRFECQVRVDGQTRTVVITVKNERGVYEVGHPR